MHIKKLLLIIGIALCGTWFACAAGRRLSPDGAMFLESSPVRVRLEGDVACRMKACRERHVGATDAQRFAEVFESRTEKTGWQGEFWGKYMLGAAAFYAQDPDPVLLDKMNASTARVISTQDADGYLGNYAPECRFDGRWSIWCMKYTLEGLLAHYAVAQDKKSLSAAERLAGLLMKEFSSGRRELRKTGVCHSLPSCSILESFVRLFRLTGKNEYLDFSRYIVAQLDEAEDSARLIRDALAGVDVAERDPQEKINCQSSRKAYEMMSCCVGLLEYYGVTGEKRCLDSVVKTAENILATEIMVTGSGASREYWFHGRLRQVKPYLRIQETCVTVTWMRLLARLVALAGRADFADAFENAFHNAFLSSLHPDGSAFSSYTPLAGFRCYGQDHCKMFANCCNANGPRGFAFFRDAFATLLKDGTLSLNLYSSGTVEWQIPSGATAKLELYTRYPEEREVTIVNRTRERADYRFRLRIPAWSTNTVVTLNDRRLPGIVPGEYLQINRTWDPGDVVKVAFDFSVRPHVIGDAVAFTVGPLVLAHDIRLGRGVLSALRGIECGRAVDSWRVRVPEGVDARAAYALLLDDSGHDESPHNKHPSVVIFCDFASAGTTWDESSAYQTWFPLELRPDHSRRPGVEIDSVESSP